MYCQLCVLQESYKLALLQTEINALQKQKDDFKAGISSIYFSLQSYV